MSANRIDADGTPRFATSHLGLFCLPMTHKKDARLIWVNNVTLVVSINFKVFALDELDIHTCSEGNLSCDYIFCSAAMWDEILN